MHPLTVRPARAADAGEIASIWNAMIRDTLFTFTDLEKTEAEVRDLIATRPSFLVASDTQLRGFVTYGTFRNGPGYAATGEHTIVLTEGARGAGTGRALMTAMEAVAARRGIHVMMAGISAVNEGGLRFHAALGYVEVGRLLEVGRKGGRWLDLVLMQKTLARP